MIEQQQFYTEINIANLTNSFLGRDGSNTAIGAIHMNSHIIKNVADPLSNQDVAIKNYVNTNAFTTAGGVVSVEIKLKVGSDLVRSLGCNDLSAGKKFTLLLGSDKNTLTYSVPNSGLPVPVKIKTDVGIAILITRYLYVSLTEMKYYAVDPSIWISNQSRM